jgi:hypothetical protein
VQITYPNTAKILVEWLQAGMPEMTTDYVENIWNTVDIKHIRN